MVGWWEQEEESFIANAEPRPKCKPQTLLSTLIHLYLSSTSYPYIIFHIFHGYYQYQSIVYAKHIVQNDLNKGGEPKVLKNVVLLINSEI